MNKKSSSIVGDIPMKLVNEFTHELSLPLTHIINSIFETKKYPEVWKKEVITPIPKIYPASRIKDLRPISGLHTFAKAFDRIIAEYMTDDMSEKRDPHQYGNEKGLSVNHYLINLVHKILTGVDQNSNKNKQAAILTMIDYAQAFERQSHKLGVQSFVKNGVRKSLIPVLISFFEERKIMIKWKTNFSKQVTVSGGGAQGGTAGGILEYLSQTAGNLNFLENDEGFKFIDDSSMVEILNLVLGGLSSYNVRQQVPSDIGTNCHFLSKENFQTQTYLNKIKEWTDSHQMKLNSEKTKYMITNFCSSAQFQVRLQINENVLEQVHETKLLGVILTEDHKWNSNTENLVKRAYKRMMILRNLTNFNVPDDDLINIYKLYIRSIVEQSCVVWASSITEEDKQALERVQKIALRIIYLKRYISYNHALAVSGLESLSKRRDELC